MKNIRQGQWSTWNTSFILKLYLATFGFNYLKISSVQANSQPPNLGSFINLTMVPSTNQTSIETFFIVSKYNENCSKEVNYYIISHSPWMRFIQPSSALHTCVHVPCAAVTRYAVHGIILRDLIELPEPPLAVVGFTHVSVFQYFIGTLSSPHWLCVILISFTFSSESSLWKFKTTFITHFGGQGFV